VQQAAGDPGAPGRRAVNVAHSPREWMPPLAGRVGHIPPAAGRSGAAGPTFSAPAPGRTMKSSERPGSGFNRMLRELSVQNLALIEDVRVELEPGFCAWTGETGAGKSLLLGALGLLLGERGSAELLRTGADELP